jgi:hypothetical protein
MKPAASTGFGATTRSPSCGGSSTHDSVVLLLVLSSPVLRPTSVVIPTPVLDASASALLPEPAVVVGVPAPLVLLDSPLPGWLALSSRRCRRVL